MFCQEWCLVKRLNPTLTVIPMRCRCWHCEECRPGRVQRLIHEAKSGKPTLFITLTSRRRSDRSPSWAAQELVRAWRTIRSEYLKKHGKGSLAFLAVFEETKKGWPHLHIVARCKWLDQRWLSKRMAALHDSPVVDVRRVTGLGKVANYITKYIGKNPYRFEGVKRYWRSLDYLSPIAVPDSGGDGPPVYWDRVQEHWLKMAECLERVGFIAVYGRREVVLRYGVPP